MAMVKFNIDENYQLSEESLARLAALKDRPIDYSDIPKRTPEQIKEMMHLAVEKRKKQMFSLRLCKPAIEWWKETVGAGYTGVMARLLEQATKHPEWIKESLKSR